MPAVVLLDEIRTIVAESYPDQPIGSIDRCKFQDFVLPDRPFEIILTVSDGSAINFACHAADNGRLLASGLVGLVTRGSAI